VFNDNFYKFSYLEDIFSSMHENIFHNIHIIDVYFYIDVYSIHALFACSQSHVHHDIVCSSSFYVILKYLSIQPLW